MPEELVVQYGPQLRWILRDTVSGEVRLRGRGSLEELEERLADIYTNAAMRIIVPGESVLLTRVDVPSKQPRQVQQAVPFLVEEQLASDVDDCFFAIGEPQGKSRLVTVINHAYFLEVMDAFSAISLTPDAIEVDLALVPVTESAAVWVDGQRAHIREVDGSGVTVALDQLAGALSLIPGGAVLQAHVHPDNAAEADVQFAAARASSDITINVVQLDEDPFEALTAYNSTNLLQGPYRVEEKRTTTYRGWQVAAMLAALVFTLHLLSVLSQAIFLDIKADQYASEVRALYGDVFPSDRNVRDHRRRWRSHLSGGFDGANFMSVFAEASVGIPGSRLELQNVNFNESRGDLILQLTASRGEQLVAYSQSLSQSGMAAEIGTISQEESGVRGSIKIRSYGN